MSRAATRAPYDRIATDFAAAQRGFRSRPFVDRFLALVVPGARVLDLGCGTGVPIARHLLDHGLAVTGVDAAGEMLRRARESCPEMELRQGDMETIELPEVFGGLVAWDSVFHVPRDDHAALFARFAGWLLPGAPLLLSLGGSADDFTSSMFGVDFYYSAHTPEVSLELLRAAGFELVHAEIDDPSSRGHLAIVARREDRSQQTDVTG